MRRALYISLLLWLPLLAAAGGVFLAEVYPLYPGSPLFLSLLGLWLLNGFICLVAAIGVWRQVFLGLFPGRAAAVPIALAALGSLLGIAPAYVLLDLFLKLLEYLRRWPG